MVRSDMIERTLFMLSGKSEMKSQNVSCIIRTPQFMRRNVPRVTKTVWAAPNHESSLGKPCVCRGERAKNFAVDDFSWTNSKHLIIIAYSY
jgi:hypothetical protein